MRFGKLLGVSRYRLQPSPAQEAALLEHCGHARYVWNLAVEQHAHWQRGRASAPGFAEQCRQLTEARAACAWLAAGSVIVQQQALKDFHQAMANFFGQTHQRPTWRRAADAKVSGSSRSRRARCAASRARWARCASPRWGGCGFAGRAPCSRPNPSG
ncbi:helix-turn-helix domain-containing protein [Streptosporangium lutulentum]